MKRPSANVETATDPIQIIEEEPTRISIMVQTIPQIPEQEFDDPLPLLIPDEPLHFGMNYDDDVNSEMSLTSQVPEPAEEQPYVLELPPPQEPEEEPITDDWALSELFEVIR